MLKPPALAEDSILAFLEKDYGLRVDRIAFLPLGADRHSAAFSVVGEGGTHYFLKLRSGRFDPIAVALPSYLHSQGVSAVIAPLKTLTGRLWTVMEGHTGILYPFIRGQNAYERGLSDRQWRALGAALGQVHQVKVPSEIKGAIRQETYPPDWRSNLERYLDWMEERAFDDELAAELACFLSARRAQVLDLIRRASRLAEVLRAGVQKRVLCHSDLHAGNLLMAEGGELYIVDWDEPILAPRERDLMYSGGGLMGGWRAPLEEEALFYTGYGPTEVDAAALAYYRYERIVVDLAEFCSQILPAHGSLEDRQQSLRYVKSNFLPGGTVAIAYQSDRSGQA